MTLTDIIEIRELVPHISVERITREKIMPHDSLVIDGRHYRVNRMERLKNNETSFESILTP